jgi:hypothetical protein
MDFDSKNNLSVGSNSTKAAAQIEEPGVSLENSLLTAEIIEAPIIDSPNTNATDNISEKDSQEPFKQAYTDGSSSKARR